MMDACAFASSPSSPPSSPLPPPPPPPARAAASTSRSCARTSPTQRQTRGSRPPSGLHVDPENEESFQHDGVDLVLAEGKNVYAAASGLVRLIVLENEDGDHLDRYLLIDHLDGFVTIYGNVDPILVAVDDEVKQGSFGR